MKPTITVVSRRSAWGSGVFAGYLGGFGVSATVDGGSRALGALCLALAVVHGAVWRYYARAVDDAPGPVQLTDRQGRTIARLVDR